MAESLAKAVADRAGKSGPIVHFTGAFHSDFGAGTAERTRRRLAGKQVAVVSMLPVADLDAGRTEGRRSRPRGFSGLYGEVSRGSGLGASGLRGLMLRGNRGRFASEPTAA